MPTFNNEASLRAFPQFQILDHRIQSIILQMLKDDRLNNYGGIKRPPNAWMLFRSDMLAVHPEMSSMSQADVTVRCKTHWAVASLQERAELQARARQANDQLFQYFPDYSYKPMSTEVKLRWKKLNITQRKEFWIASAAHIAEKIANPSKPWGGFLTLNKWADEYYPTVSRRTLSQKLGAVTAPPVTGSTSKRAYPTSRPPPQPQRTCKPDGGPFVASSSKLHTTSSRFHPYSKQTKVQGSSTKRDAKEQTRTQHGDIRKVLPPGPLKNVLVPIDPRSNSQRKRLVLSMFQLKGKMVWVSELIDDQVPDDVLRQLSDSTGPNETSPDHLVLRDYTDPWVPEAMNEYGESFYPDIRSISEYYEYMEAYYSSREHDSEFIWPPPARSPPSLSRHSPSGFRAPPTLFLRQDTELFSSNPRDSSLPGGNPTLDFGAEISPPEIPGTNLISGSHSDSVATPEDLGW
ncbi:unnamed protein product [Rhizoctonia solani]|uniref:HMG box domain-containing protein n=1 Tax=Rhizoctonia solani TaxID=456999 RepID=A0A8H3GWT3_9AGAM|nr:unnamed protein product [Rhizoctonia solani]